jgi:hypothetical protein
LKRSYRYGMFLLIKLVFINYIIIKSYYHYKVKVVGILDIACNRSIFNREAGQVRNLNSINCKLTTTKLYGKHTVYSDDDGTWYLLKYMCISLGLKALFT